MALTAPVDIGQLVTQNPLQQIGQALAQLPQQQQAAQLQNQAVGEQMLAPYFKMLRADSSLYGNPRFMGTIHQIASRYNIPIPQMGDTEQTPAQSTGATQPSPQSEQPQATATTPQAAPPSGPTMGPGAAMAMGAPPAAPMSVPSIPGVVPGAGATPSEAMEQKLISDKGPQPNAAMSMTPQQPAAPAAQPGAQAAPAAQPTKSQGGPSSAWATFIGANLDPSTVLALQAMQPEQRSAYLQSIGIDPKWAPKSLLDEKPVLTPEMREKVVTGITRQLDDLTGKGELTPEAFQRIVKLNQSMGLLDDEGAQALLSDPDYLNQMGQGLKTKLDLMLQAGLIKQGDYQVKLANLQRLQSGTSSLNQFRSWEENVLGKARVGYMSVVEQNLNARTAIESQHDADQAQYWSGMLQEGGQRLSLQQYSQLSMDLRSAQSHLTDLVKQASTIKANGGNPTDSLTTGTDAQGNPVPGGLSIAQQIINQKAVVQALGDAVQQANSGYRNVNQALHKQGVQTSTGGQSGIPQGAIPGTLPNGKHGYQLNGKLYLDNGTPYTQ